MRGAWVAIAAACGVLAAACTTTSAACDCADPDVTISIPEDIGASVSGVSLAGPACAGVTPQCTNTTNGCTTYRFQAAGAGACEVTVAFADGTTFTQALTFAQSGGCCPAPYAVGSSQVDVPEPGDGGRP